VRLIWRQPSLLQGKNLMSASDRLADPRLIALQPPLPGYALNRLVSEVEKEVAAVGFVRRDDLPIEFARGRLHRSDLVELTPSWRLAAETTVTEKTSVVIRGVPASPSALLET
jgi:hypothetical protein